MKNRKKIRNSLVVRIYLLCFLVLLGMFVILGKIFYMSFLNSKPVKDVLEQHALRVEHQQPHRGDIYDAKGRLLATSRRCYDIYMDPCAGGLTDDLFNKNIDSLSLRLSNFFKDMTPAEYKEKLTKSRKQKRRYVSIAKDISRKEHEILKTFPLFKYEKNKGGLIEKPKMLRANPFGQLMLRTIGYVAEDKKNKLIQGRAGLEYTYERELGGRIGKSYRKKISGNNWLTVKNGKIIDVESGLDLITSIDIDLQDYVDRVLKKQLTDLRAEHGSVVVMEVKTGYIKAIANLQRSKDNTFEEAQNYAVGENLAPGSTFKLPVLMAALEDDLISLDEKIETGNGHIVYKGVPVDDVKKGGYGTLNVKQVFAKSSNVGMVKIVDKCYVKTKSIRHFLKQLDALGIGTKSGIDIYGEHKPMIKSPGNRLWAPSTPGMMAQGYEIKISPLQLLTFYNAIANNGCMVKPRVVKSFGKNGEPVKNFEPEVINSSICSKQTLNKAREILREVVLTGTASCINTPEYAISGKTGTAEYYDSKTKKHTGLYRASFVGYFPSEKPKYSIIVVINQPEINYYGALAAAPVFRQISDKIFRSDRDLNPPAKTPPVHEIPYSKNGAKDDLLTVFKAAKIRIDNENIQSRWVKTEACEQQVRMTNARIKKGIMPDLQFFGAKDAVCILSQMGLNTKLIGRGFVLFQSIPAGQPVAKGQTIKLELR
ncbi:MAG: peptidoglycan glycosyltransferase [Bacteroidia bacterium]|nr:MAG: peptidoglycan glycosyltransferase [Bacteroidia bacterium]